MSKFILATIDTSRQYYYIIRQERKNMTLAIQIWFGFLVILLAVNLLIGQLFSTKGK